MENKLEGVKLTKKELIFKVELEIRKLFMSPENYYADLTDIGNEIGRIISGIVTNNIEDVDGFEISDLLMGIEHGWSLNDGTH